MTALTAFWRNETPEPPPADAAPAPLRTARSISALGIIAIFLALHLANHLTFILGPDTYRAVMKAMRHGYCQEFSATAVGCAVPVSGRHGVYLATHTDVRPMGRFRTFQIASSIFLAAYVLGQMNAVFVSARLYCGTRRIFQASLTDPDGAPWRRRSRCRCRIMAWTCSSCCRIAPPERAG